MSNAVKLINEIPANKAGIKLFAEALVSAVMDGRIDPLTVRMRIDAIEKVIKAVKANTTFSDAVIDQADLHPDKTFEHMGVSMTKAEAARYDYTRDPIWNELKAAEQEAADARKSQEAFLRTLPKPVEVDGVLRYPPSKRSTSTLRITF